MSLSLLSSYLPIISLRKEGRRVENGQGEVTNHYSGYLVERSYLSSYLTHLFIYLLYIVFGIGYKKNTHGSYHFIRKIRNCLFLNRDEGWRHLQVLDPYFDIHRYSYIWYTYFVRLFTHIFILNSISFHNIPPLYILRNRTPSTRLWWSTL